MTAAPERARYGTYDQLGNVFEWTETLKDTSALYPGSRVTRGGSWDHSAQYAHANWREGTAHLTEASTFGFRVAAVIPEPLTVLGLTLSIGSLAGYLRKRSLTGS